ncbi:hypothetical protein TNCV_2195711, partial [Trichonephila clavipes]
SSSTDDPANEAKHSYYGQNRWLQYPSSPVGVAVKLNCVKDRTTRNFHSGRIQTKSKLSVPFFAVCQIPGFNRYLEATLRLTLQTT